MNGQDRKSKLKKLDALYITHNFLDCLIVYFCICFTFIRSIYDLLDVPDGLRHVYGIALLFMVGMGTMMMVWARRTVKELRLENIL